MEIEIDHGFAPGDQIHKIEVEHRGWSEVYFVGQVLREKAKEGKNPEPWGTVDSINRECVGSRTTYTITIAGINSNMTQVVKVFDNMPVSASYLKVPGL
jgi:hypothetical protein